MHESMRKLHGGHQAKEVEDALEADGRGTDEWPRTSMTQTGRLASTEVTSKSCLRLAKDSALDGTLLSPQDFSAGFVPNTFKSHRLCVTKLATEQVLMCRE
ncbi:hypothetical protein PoB_006719500 [Plakobranchus ocellatus]|uniref:Uncharacterized protein n=1 Tax=Plakobranchus ocellatus TaxID=259542 RepID=A0AAV4D991_9GAST|nr:hypothetical protein PoB_006719500 [Plakobranchus ocellatus]